MTEIKNFNGLAARLRSEGRKRQVVVVCPDDDHTQQVICRALNDGIANFLLVNVGGQSVWSKFVTDKFKDRVQTFGAADADDAANKGVELVRQGRGDALMKGRLNTDNLLRAVLNKEHGLMALGHVLTHITVAEIPQYNRLLLFSDAAVIPAPTTEQFEAIVGYGSEVCRALGFETPRIALIHCTEKVSEKFPHTISYQIVKQKAAENQFGPVLVDGPMDVKTACDAESGRIKGIASPVAGQADMLVFPDIQAGNTFYKTITLFAGARTAGMLCGTTRPVVVASRADSVESKYNSLLLACSLME